MGLRICTFVTFASLLSNQMHKYCRLLQDSSEKIAIFEQSLKKRRLPQIANDEKRWDEQETMNLCKYIY